MEQPKISIIVPIYNVEPWLRKCLDSIKNQTYRNLEIVLVDDGSPDNCPAICDEYAANDPRFKVIHKPNGGVSSARNAGLDAATGEWIGFVDSDDWVEPDMYEYLLENARTHGTDIAVCGMDEGGLVWEGGLRSFPEKRVLNREAALEKQITLEIRDSCVDKMYRKELWDGIHFSTRDIAEDFSVMWQLMERVEAVVCLPEIKYHYCRREGSLTATNKLADWMDNYDAAKERYDALRTDWPQFEIFLAERCIRAAYVLWAMYGAAPAEERRAVRSKMKEISVFCRPYVKRAKERAGGSAGRVLTALVAWPTWWAFTLARIVEMLYEKKHGSRLL